MSYEINIHKKSKSCVRKNIKEQTDVQKRKKKKKSHQAFRRSKRQANKNCETREVRMLHSGRRLKNHSSKPHLHRFRRTSGRRNGMWWRWTSYRRRTVHHVIRSITDHWLDFRWFTSICVIYIAFLAAKFRTLFSYLLGYI